MSVGSRESARDTPRLRRASRRAALSGSGPAPHDAVVGRNPGARERFGLFGEVLQTGLLVTLVGIAVVTLPAGLAAGARHLRRHVRGEDSRLALFWADVRSAILPGSVVGLIALVLTGILLLDIDLAGSGALPGGAAIAVVGWVGLAAVATALLLTVAAWTPERGWRGALRTTPATLRRDPRAALYMLATAVFVCVTTWALIPLFVPAIGCAALAAIAVPERLRVHD